MQVTISVGKACGARIFGTKEIQGLTAGGEGVVGGTRQRGAANDVSRRGILHRIQCPAEEIVRVRRFRRASDQRGKRVSEIVDDVILESFVRLVLAILEVTVPVPVPGQVSFEAEDHATVGVDRIVDLGNQISRVAGEIAWGASQRRGSGRRQVGVVWENDVKRESQGTIGGLSIAGLATGKGRINPCLQGVGQLIRRVSIDGVMLDRRTNDE